MNLGEFKDELRSAIARGDSYDDRLGGFARRAARWIEQNHTLQYMRRRVDMFSTAAERVILLPTNMPLKAVLYVRFEPAGGEPLICSKGELSDPDIQWVSTERYSSAGTLWPSHFYLDGVEAMIFNRTFPEALSSVGMVARYSDFPKQDHQTHWLLVNGEGAMLRRSMIEFMLDARDDRGAAALTTALDTDMKALLNADYEMQHAGSDIQLGG